MADAGMSLENFQQSCIIEIAPLESDIMDADDKDMLTQSKDCDPFETDADSEKNIEQPEVVDVNHVSILKTNNTLFDSIKESPMVTGNAASERKGLDFMYKMVDLMFREVVVDETKRDSKVCDFRQPNELSSLLMDLPIGKEGVDTNKLLNLVEVFVKNSVKTAHPRFFNQLFGGLSKYAIGGAWCSEALNSSMYTYEVAPVFTLMEREIYNKMLAFIGFENGDAIFAPGGSMSNLYAMNIARHHKFPHLKTKGMTCSRPLCVFASDQSHYSIQKAAATLGIGSDNVRLVRTDTDGCMLCYELKNEIIRARAEGLEPFMVVATAGTTVYGAYDPIANLAPICKENGLWLHVDGAWGGSVALTKKYRHLIEGVENADSMTWNAHKMMGVSQQCSIFLTNHKGLLLDCHSAKARYLFQSDKHYDVSYDTGDMSLQCGRRNDVLKLWLAWKAIGDEGMERDVEHLFELSRYLAAQVEKRESEGFRLIMKPMCTNVCFWYIPPRLRHKEETPSGGSRLENSLRPSRNG